MVLGVSRFFEAGSEPPASNTNLIQAGEILLTELMCINCHAAPESQSDRFPLRLAPNLTSVAARLQQGYTKSWLENPHETKPGTIMPDLIAHRTQQEKQRIADALLQFLWANSEPEMKPVSTPAGNAANGRHLFHSIGCVACHSPRKDYRPTAAGHSVSPDSVKDASVPLINLSDKYTREGLRTFLLHPEHTRPSYRMPRVPLSDSEANDLVAYLAPAAPREPRPARLDQMKVDQGRQHYAELRCAACHESSNLTRPVSTKPKASPLTDLAGKSGGCLSDTPIAGAAQYALSAWQRAALTAALKKSRLNNHARPLTAAETLHRKLVSLNCLACHSRDEMGGPDGNRLAYFETTGADLEDEGRFPPTLSGVGRKMQQPAIERTLRGDWPVRPYMQTRMPDFGPEHARQLAATFALVDADPDERPLYRPGEENRVGRNLWGRNLLGLKGLGCIQCHPLMGHKSLGIQAMDLAHTSHRLRPEWLRDYLLDPAAFRPGTRMPAFWPDGKPLTKGNGGSTHRQIDSIRVYLNELEQSRLPEGMESTGDFEIIPSETPVVFRTFLQDAGLHAIAVGFPTKIHVAFDAKQIEWSLAWKGAFLDAESTWDDRFTPWTKPLGTNVLHLRAGIELAPDPSASKTIGTKKFLGYRIEKDGVPVFHYEVGGVSISDRMTPTANGDAVERQVQLRPSPPSTWVRLAAGNQLSAMPSGRWLIDNTYSLELLSHQESDNHTRIVATRNRSSLWLHLTKANRDKTTVSLRIKWND